MKPELDTFEAAVKKYRGNISRVASAFGVTRWTVSNWVKEDHDFKQAVNDARMRLFDECLTSAEALALGVAERDEKGNFLDWKRIPDGNMLRYLMSTLGKEEGFGENVDVTTNGKDICQQIVFSPTPLTDKDIQEIKDIQSGKKGSDDTGISET